MLTWSDTVTGRGNKAWHHKPSHPRVMRIAHSCSHTCTNTTGDLSPNHTEICPHHRQPLSYYLFPLYLSSRAYKHWIRLWDRNRELNISTFIRLVCYWEGARARTHAQSSHSWQREERESVKTKWLLQWRTDETEWGEEGWRKRCGNQMKGIWNKISSCEETSGEKAADSAGSSLQPWKYTSTPTAATQP